MPFKVGDKVRFKDTSEDEGKEGVFIITLVEEIEVFGVDEPDGAYNLTSTTPGRKDKEGKVLLDFYESVRGDVLKAAGMSTLLIICGVGLLFLINKYKLFEKK